MDKTEIKSITAVNQEGSSRYYVGQVINGLTVYKIIDNSFADGCKFNYEYMGEDEKGLTVFKIINIGVDIKYMKVNK